jgi:hypothetical protein
MSEETKVKGSGGSSRMPRSASGRDSTKARQPWRPPQILETPEPPPGMRYRWLRTHIRGEADKTNVHMRMREGYEVVNPAEVVGYDLPTIDEGSHAGTVGVGGLMLAKIPDETAEERNAYFQNRTENQMNAVDNDLMKDEHPSMPISNERKSKVTFGGSNK